MFAKKSINCMLVCCKKIICKRPVLCTNKRKLLVIKVVINGHRKHSLKLKAVINASPKT